MAGSADIGFTIRLWVLISRARMYPDWLYIRQFLLLNLIFRMIEIMLRQEKLKQKLSQKYTKMNIGVTDNSPVVTV